MEIEQRIFKGAKPIFSRLEEYGFSKTEQGYAYSKALESSLIAEVFVSFQGEARGRVIDGDTGDEYAPLQADNAVGGYVAAVREEYGDLLRDIVASCFKKELFAFPQSNRLAKHISQAYGEAPDFPFVEHEYAVFRRQDNRKWYALLMDLPKAKLSKAKGKRNEEEGEERVDALNIKADPLLIPRLIEKEAAIYPCYHMNRKMWITVVLDGSLDDETLYSLVDRSRFLVADTKKEKAKK